MINEEYDKLRKQHNLPDFNKLNNEFEINSIENEEFLLREIRRKITEKFMAFIDVLEGAITPTESTVHMYESNFLTESDRKAAFALFKELMYFVHMSSEAALYAENEKDAEFITLCFDSWMKMKDEIGVIVSKLKDGWRKKFEKRTGEKYFI